MDSNAEKAQVPGFDTTRRNETTDSPDQENDLGQQRERLLANEEITLKELTAEIGRLNALVHRNATTAGELAAGLTENYSIGFALALSRGGEEAVDMRRYCEYGIARNEGNHMSRLPDTKPVIPSSSNTKEPGAQQQRTALSQVGFGPSSK